MSPLYKTSHSYLDIADSPELVLEIPSFAAGENTIGQDGELKVNEARLIENWDATSIGGMKRVKGFTLVATGTGGVVSKLDLAAHHFEGTSTAFYAISAGNLMIKSGANLNIEDAAAFTSGVLSHAVSAGSKLWITNATDNLKYKSISVAIATPTSVPPTASARVYEHVFRLIAEGSGNTVYGSRAGVGNWTTATAWSASNDAWSMVMPDTTQGAVPGFPSGPELTVFTKFDTYVIYNQPNVARRRITNGIGCQAPYSIAKGTEGVFFLSKYPTLGIYLWDSVNYVNLTEKHDFVNNINLSQRIYGTYKDNKYYFFYNETGSGVSYPNRLKIFDAKLGRWYTRVINSSVADNFGYPSLQTKVNNELYVGSSNLCKLYDVDDSSTSDNGFATQANYKTKVFTSKDFRHISGSGIPNEYIRMKLIKVSVSYYGVGGNWSILWTTDRGINTNSQTFDFQSLAGDLINTTFTVNTSSIIAVSSLPNREVTKSFGNSAIGREFEFQILQQGTGTRPEIKNIKIMAIALEEH